MNVRGERFPYFDSLRAIAALLVLATHAAVFAGRSGLTPYAARLESGVAIFFVISGFLLYRPFARARLYGERPPGPLGYGWRRFLRIVPAYWVALTIAALVVPLDNVFNWTDGPLYYGFAQTWKQWTIGGGLTQAWTLCIEVSFYIFLPVWAWAMRSVRGTDFKQRVRGELIALGSIFVLSIAWKIALLADANPHQIVIKPVLESLPSFLDEFALGMALAVLSLWVAETGAMPRGFRLLQRRPILSWLFAAAMLVIAAKGIGLTGRTLEPFSPAQYVGLHMLYAGLGLGMVLPAVLGGSERSVVHRILTNRALMWLGLISYSIFLWSMPVVRKLDSIGFEAPDVIHPLLWWFLVSFAITIPIAALSYYLVERPALSLKRLVPTRGVRRDEAIAEPAPATPPGPQPERGTSTV